MSPLVSLACGRRVLMALALSATAVTGCGSVTTALGQPPALDGTTELGPPPSSGLAEVAPSKVGTPTTTPLAASSTIPPTNASQPSTAPPGLEEAIAAAILAQDSAGFTAPEAACVSRALVLDLGVDGLTALAGDTGQTPTLSDISRQDRAVLADAMVGCMDLRRMLLHELEGSLPLPKPTLECIADDLVADGSVATQMRNAVVAGGGLVTDEASLAAPMLAALTRCVTSEDHRLLAEQG